LRVIYRPQFLRDLRDAYSWIAADNERAAEHLSDQVDAIVDRLTRFPMIGAQRDRLAPGLRSIRVRPFRHLLIYRVAADEIDLIRLLHGARALEKQDYAP
jgi:addiction module RelE/StbE family toxin